MKHRLRSAVGHGFAVVALLVVLAVVALLRSIARPRCYCSLRPLPRR